VCETGSPPRADCCSPVGRHASVGEPPTPSATRTSTYSHDGVSPKSVAAMPLSRPRHSFTGEAVRSSAGSENVGRSEMARAREAPAEASISPAMASHHLSAHRRRGRCSQVGAGRRGQDRFSTRRASLHRGAQRAVAERRQQGAKEIVRNGLHGAGRRSYKLTRCSRRARSRLRVRLVQASGRKGHRFSEEGCDAALLVAACDGRERPTASSPTGGQGWQRTQVQRHARRRGTAINAADLRQWGCPVCSSRAIATCAVKAREIMGEGGLTTVE